MADEQDKWLDRVAAERLLRGERLDGIGDHDRERAERLARTLAALSAGKPAKTGADGELPGECGAVAAFRAARGGRTFTSETSEAHGTSEAAGAVGPVGSPLAPGVVGGVGGAPDPADEPVRIGGPAVPPRRVRWGRPVRLGAAAALAACMAGGVAVAAGAGVIPSPFHRSDREPATSASPVQTPERPLRSPSTDAPARPDEVPDAEESLLDDGKTAEPDDSATPEDPERSGTPDDDGGADRGATGSPGTDDVDPGKDAKRNSRKWYKHVVSACRDYRSGALANDRRRSLEEAARGSERVRSFCQRVLDGKGKDQDDDEPGRGNGGNGGGHGNGGNGGGKGDDEDDDHGGPRPPGGGHHGGRPGGGSHVPPVTLPHHPRPVPSYTAAPVF
ncbi:hypothetical protein [Streptomyces spectabilis]|uniref:Extensin n=1 Tax=Streptomyces spectabilis TaxID=68270 RepID=A0A5P2X9T4_STRST|nr:hypothetical protein [Streptomyces spectabilis]MBB5107632.1 hypothetical protein [Streptomyces spectabilis]MCI3904702.1 hypothetical protein [Streptomyces spectabilis]QEV61773.1 hypothetical protein CP982_26210 [Streptomyces spectabilis]GGV03133.1 hypothetical protein GCM10010245_08090 [Streptomyces spectabilis]